MKLFSNLIKNPLAMLCAFVAMAVGAIPTFAGETVTLPDAGINWNGIGTAAFAAVGAVIAIALTLKFGMIVIRKGAAWMGRF